MESFYKTLIIEMELARNDIQIGQKVRLKVGQEESYIKNFKKVLTNKDKGNRVILTSHENFF